MTFAEQSVFGTVGGRKTFSNTFAQVYEGKKYNQHPFDRKIVDGKQINIESKETVIANSDSTLLSCQSSTEMISPYTYDAVITDPPYAGNVNYAELADFFYVWLKITLQNTYSAFAPEYVPKNEEIIENKTRGKSAKDYKKGLAAVFAQAYRQLNHDGVMAFTFHHAETSAWEALLEALCESGYYLEAVYPIQGEAENSMHLMANDAISYDLIHVCRKNDSNEVTTTRAWAGIRQEIRRRAREEARLIESGRYGKESLSAADIAILLIGKCLEQYSRHYGAVVDHEDKPVPIHRALAEIRMMVDQIISHERPLPQELENIDVPSYIFFTTLCRQREIKSDDISKSTRGMMSIDELKKCGLLIKGREKRGRSFEIKQPLERLNDLKEKFQSSAITAQTDLFAETEEAILPADLLLVDCVQLLLGLAEAGENALPWLEKLRGLKPQIRAALQYLQDQNKSYAASANKILGLIDERTLFSKS